MSRPVATRPPARAEPAATPDAGRPMLRNAAAGSLWTAVSRTTGLVETITVGAILGATYLGNTYQAVNSLPNLVYYQLLAGSLFASLLVPPLVAHVDRGDLPRAEVLVGGFLGRLLFFAAIACGLVLAAGQLVVRLLTLAVRDPSVAHAQQHVGWYFLIMFVPQIPLYAVAGTWGAVQNAHGRFALAAAAPTFENLGLIATLVVAGIVFGSGSTIEHVPGAELLLLGLGTTGAVALHAGVQRWGARKTGIRFRPAAGWRDPEVRTVLRRIPPTLAYTGLEAAQIVAILVVANRLAGGLVAFQLALSFFFLPMAIITWPLGRALLPELTRAHGRGDGTAFRDQMIRAVRVASFVSVPIAVAYLTVSSSIAGAVTVGQLASARGVHLVAISLAALGIGVIGESWFILGTYAFYARQNVRGPLLSMMVRTGVFVAALVAAWKAPNDHLLIWLGGSISVAALAGAVHIWARLRRGLPEGTLPLAAPLARILVASLAMAVPAALTAQTLRGLGQSELAQLVALALAATVGLLAYVGIQALWRAPELSWLRTELFHRRAVA